MSRNPLVSILIVTYNSKRDIGECLKSVFNQSYGNFEVIVVDNASSDGTPEYVQKRFPTVKVVKCRRNLGYSGGNVVGLRYARGDYIVILNPDTVVDKYWLKELVEGARRYPDAGMIGSNVLLYGEPRTVNACGNEFHFTGLVFSRFFGGCMEKCREEYILVPSGAAFMIRRCAINDVGFMDEDFFTLFADIDLALRFQLRGWKCVVISSSKVYHKFLLKMSPLRFFRLERGRYLALLKNFDKETLVLLLPSLVLTEILTWGFALLRGRKYVMSKIMTYRWILRSKQRILEKRRQIQKFRRVYDRELLRLTTWKINVPQQWLKNGFFKRFVELLFNAFYFFLFRAIWQLLPDHSKG